MSRLKPLIALSILVAFTATTGTSQAGWWSSLWNKITGKKEGYHTVVVTSNYIKSVLLAELIQNKNKQPIILLPTGKESDKVYALNAKGQGAEFSKAKFSDVIERLNPKVVIFLGDEQFAPKSYIDQAKKLFPTVIISQKDFDKVAVAAGIIMRQKKLAATYDKMLKQIDSKGKVKRDPNSVWGDLAKMEGVSSKKPTPSKSTTRSLRK